MAAVKHVYSPEIKAQALELYFKTGEIRGTARALGLTPSLVQKWIDLDKALPSQRKATAQDKVARVTAGQAGEDEITTLLADCSKEFLKRLKRTVRDPNIDIGVEVQSRIVDRLIAALHSRVDVRKGEPAPVQARTITREEKIQKIIAIVGGGTALHTETLTATVTDDSAS